ncbi:MAG: hypothetical protein ABL958_07035 [Bdellovibrionia bacterium]
MNLRAYNFHILPFLVLCLFVGCSTKSGPSKPKSTEFVSKPSTESVLPSDALPSTGAKIAEYVEQHWPSYLTPANSLADRRHNLEFLRDRIIEVGLCAGLNLGWHVENADLSVNKIALRDDEGQKFQIQIVSDYVNIGQPLKLTWTQSENGNYLPFTPSPACN